MISVVRVAPGHVGRIARSVSIGLSSRRVPGVVRSAGCASLALEVRRGTGDTSWSVMLVRGERCPPVEPWLLMNRLQACSEADP